jgi:flagellar biosynthesis/type III secretory pathway M-ring protein FliF/YscJ
LNGSTNKDSSSGLSSSQKKIIIGVVVGVGGAIIIGAIAVVMWRIRVRRRAAADNDEAADLMSGTAVGTGAREKAPSPGAGGTPFRSTLDQYHNPGPVNAASNF